MLTMKQKKSTVKGRWTNLMFSQRNNPYCDLLKNMVQIYAFVSIPQNNFSRNFRVSMFNSDFYINH